MPPTLFFFVSQNPFKYEELRPLFTASGLNVAYRTEHIKELQSDNLREDKSKRKR